MCGFYIYPEGFKVNLTTEASVKKRGPDKYNTLHRNGYVFNHALLSLTGAYTPQPFDNGNFTLLFNGEIYNYKGLGGYVSEIECLAQIYEREYLDFVNLIDGEFVIVIFDWARSEVVIASDVFGTKPIFINSMPEGIELASVPSVNSNAPSKYNVAIPPNSITIIDLDSGKIKSRFNYHFFDLNQNVGHLDLWLQAFDRAVRKRLPEQRLSGRNGRLFIGLSSGYDSGCIAAKLCETSTPFSAYTVIKPEIYDDIFARSKEILHIADHILIRDTRADLFIFGDPELFEFDIYSMDGNYREKNSSTKTDSGARGLAMICEQAVARQERVYLSGSGADEIYSDYGYRGSKIFNHSNFGGLFPSNLQELFPWPSFFGSTMRAYLMKEELVAGSYGIEGRYPFLDVDLTQAWLALNADLKNLLYKGPLEMYLKKVNFPTTFNQKLGF